MTSDDFLKRKRARPFQPFRVFADDGQHYDVWAFDFMLVLQDAILVGTGSRSADEIPESLIKLRLGQITGVEPLRIRSSRQQRRPRG